MAVVWEKGKSVAILHTRMGGFIKDRIEACGVSLQTADTEDAYYLHNVLEPEDEVVQPGGSLPRRYFYVREHGCYLPRDPKVLRGVARLLSEEAVRLEEGG